MESADRDKVDELLEIARENNRILRGIRKGMIWGQIASMIYWLIILGAVGWSYVYFQPYIEKYWNASKTIIGALESLEETSKTLPEGWQGILDERNAAEPAVETTP